MLTFLTSLSGAFKPWFPLLLAVLAVGGPVCIWLQGRSAIQVAEITSRYSKETAVGVARINAGAQVEVARAAAGCGETNR